MRFLPGYRYPSATRNADKHELLRSAAGPVWALQLRDLAESTVYSLIQRGGWLMDVDLVAVGARVRDARQRAGLSQRDVESRAGMSQSTLHRVEMGRRTNATLTEFDRLAQVLNVALDELLYGSAVEERVLAAARAAGCDDGALRDALQAIELLKLDDRLDAVVPHLRQVAPHPPLQILAAGSPSERGQATAGQVRTALG